MGNQTNKEKFSFSDGLSMEISLDGGSTYLDAGVFEDGIQWTFNQAISKVEWGNAENPNPQAKNLQLALAPSALASWDSSILSAISGGMISSTAVAGAPVAGATDVHASGAFALNTAYLLDGQNATGLVQTINSVTGSIDGALVLGTGYEMVQIPGGWAISYLTGVTLAQNITVNYDYTPASGFELAAGTTSLILDPYIVRLRHYTDTAFTTYDFQLEVFRVFPDANSLQLTKSGAKSDNTGYDLWNVALTGEIDTSLTDGEQLFKQFQTN